MKEQIEELYAKAKVIEDHRSELEGLQASEDDIDTELQRARDELIESGKFVEEAKLHGPMQRIKTETYGRHWRQ